MVVKEPVMTVILDETLWLWQEPETGRWHLSSPHVEFTDMKGRRRAALGILSYPVRVLEKGTTLEVGQP